MLQPILAVVAEEAQEMLTSKQNIIFPDADIEKAVEWSA